MVALNNAPHYIGTIKALSIEEEFSYSEVRSQNQDTLYETLARTRTRFPRRLQWGIQTHHAHCCTTKSIQKTLLLAVAGRLAHSGS
jgi:hypothetical protein